MFIADDQEVSIDPQTLQRKGRTASQIRGKNSNSNYHAMPLKQSDNCPSQQIHSERHAYHQHHSLVCTHSLHEKPKA